MKKNYTSSKFSQVVKPGSRTFSGTFKNNTLDETGTITITPKLNYVVAAKDFSVFNLPVEIKSVTFADSIKAYDLNNTVVATFTIDPSFEMPFVNKNIKIKFYGDAKIFESEILDTVIVLENKKTTNDYGRVYAITTVTPETNVTVVEDDNSINVSPVPNIPKIKYTISTTTKSTQSTVLATIRVQADDGYYFTKKPYLKSTFKDNIKLSFSSVTKNSENLITDYYFKLIYKNTTNTSLFNNMKAELICNAQVIKTKALEISAIRIGNPLIPIVGDNRNVRVYGSPGAEFELSFSRRSTGESILSDTYTNSSMLDPIIGSIGSLKKKIGKRGFYQFPVTFPSGYILSTNQDGSITNGTDHVYDSISGVLIGDQILVKTRSVPTATEVLVTELEPGGVANKLKFDTAVSITDNADVIFVRADEYYINIEAGENTTLASTIPSRTNPEPATADGSLERRGYNYMFNQRKNPMLKLTVSSADTTHLELNGAADIVKIGKPNASTNNLGRMGNTTHYFSISYSLTPKGGHSTINELSSPTLKFSNTELTTTDKSGAGVTTSHWTNSVAADNGGTKISIFNITQAGTGTGTYTITADVIIYKWGTKSVTMNLDLDQIIDTSA